MALRFRSWRKEVIGVDQKVPTRTGKLVRYINFDNAASTPSLRKVFEKCREFLNWYSSVHRGAGFKSQVSTAAYEDARLIALRFFGANSETNTVIFGKNTTEAINKLSYRLQIQPLDVILTTLMEHHSNELPWRRTARVKHVRLLPDGSLDMDDLESKLRSDAGRVKLVAVSGASNVTGYLNDVHQAASLAHRFGAQILVDAAQLAAHRSISMASGDSERHIDFLAASGHKMYAPFGTGLLIGPKSAFSVGDPEYVGGGTVSYVTRWEARWTHLPDREEAGSPNVVGAVALGEAINCLAELGMDAIKSHETELTSYLLEHLQEIPGVTIYGCTSPNPNRRLGVVSLNLEGFHHGLLASILAWEGGIGVRNGCFCARPYIHELLRLSLRDIRKAQERSAVDPSAIPGMVRVSFGLYNTINEVKRFINVLRDAATNPGKYKNIYELQRDGSYLPRGLTPDYRRGFSLLH